MKKPSNDTLASSIERVLQMEATGQAKGSELEAVKARQLKASRFIQARALAAIKSQPAEKGLRSVSALILAWKHELYLLGADR